MCARSRPKKRNWTIRFIFLLLFFMIAAGLGWCFWVYTQVESFAEEDQAAPSDAIAVFGAAEYDGKPSPVYRARLDHAAALFNRGIAPLVITLGGDGGDQFSEGGVGRQYLMGTGIPESAIIAETKSRSTAEAAHRLTVIARANGLNRLVVVSDGTHLFRIHALCAADGLNVLTSPRARVMVEGNSSEIEPIVHEILSYTAWRLHVEK